MTAIVPVQIACATSRMIIRGWAHKPTEVIAAGPSFPTIIVSNEFIKVSRRPSRAAGQAIWRTFLYMELSGS